MRIKPQNITKNSLKHLNEIAQTFVVFLKNQYTFFFL
jgi:hypothetical protein